MKLTKEDFEHYKEQQLMSLKASMMAIEANKVLLEWIEKQIKKTKPEKKKINLIH